MNAMTLSNGISVASSTTQKLMRKWVGKTKNKHFLYQKMPVNNFQAQKIRVSHTAF
jgi:hypothetical protein